jgi:hypothetical protein
VEYNYGEIGEWRVFGESDIAFTAMWPEAEAHKLNLSATNFETINRIPITSVRNASDLPDIRSPCSQYNQRTNEHNEIHLYHGSALDHLECPPRFFEVV